MEWLRMREADRKRPVMLEMRRLRGMLGVSKIDTVRNEDVRQSTQVKRKLSESLDQRVLRGLRIDEERMAKRVLNTLFRFQNPR